MNAERIAELKAEIAALRQQRLTIIQTGQSVSIPGSHSVTNVKLEEINAMLREAGRELLALIRGGSVTTVEVPKYARR